MSDPNYNMNEENVRRILKERFVGLPGEKIENAVAVLRSIRNLSTTDNEKYLLEFAQRLRNTDAAGRETTRFFPFAILPEQLDQSFLTLRSAGQNVLKRGHGDLAKVEMGIGPMRMEILQLIKAISTQGPEPVDKLVEKLGELNHAYDSMHGQGAGVRAVAEFVCLAKGYLYSDTESRRGTKASGFSSLGAEVAQNNGVYSFGPNDLNNLITQLEVKKIIPNKGYELNEAPEKVLKERKFGIGRFAFNYRTEAYKETYSYSGDQLRKDLGLTALHRAPDSGKSFLGAMIVGGGGK